MTNPVRPTRRQTPSVIRPVTNAEKPATNPNWAWYM